MGIVVNTVTETLLLCAPYAIAKIFHKKINIT